MQINTSEAYKLGIGWIVRCGSNTIVVKQESKVTVWIGITVSEGTVYSIDPVSLGCPVAGNRSW